MNGFYTLNIDRQSWPPVKPAANEPGSLRQQLLCIDLYLSNPARRMDPRGSWQLARRLVLPHARRAA